MTFASGEKAAQREGDLNNKQSWNTGKWKKLHVPGRYRVTWDIGGGCISVCSTKLSKS